MSVPKVVNSSTILIKFRNSLEIRQKLRQGLMTWWRFMSACKQMHQKAGCEQIWVWMQQLVSKTILIASPYLIFMGFLTCAYIHTCMYLTWVKKVMQSPTVVHALMHKSFVFVLLCFTKLKLHKLTLTYSSAQSI